MGVACGGGAAVGADVGVDNAYNTKDLADAFAGVVYGLTMQRWTWASFGVQPSPMITSYFNVEPDHAVEVWDEQQG